MIEEGLRGPELSLLVVCNGDPDGAVPLAPAQDFKRDRRRRHRAPTPVAWVRTRPSPSSATRWSTRSWRLQWRRRCTRSPPRASSYRGVLYAGLMLTADGPKVLEYNVRFGDPECQVVVPRLASDLGELCSAAAAGDALPASRFIDDACVTVVLASEGYPREPAHGRLDRGPRRGRRTSRRHRVPRRDRTRRRWRDRDRGGSGARGHARSARLSRRRATAPTTAVSMISWPGMQHRSDIAHAAAHTHLP